MGVGLGLLQLAPDAFWSMTLRELTAAVRGFYGEGAPVAPLERREFAALMRSFPDQ